jgi:hypothetical protein
MSLDGSPPSSWYDPPEPRHSDRTIIPPECNCTECHTWHCQEGTVAENAKTPDFQCCADQMEEWFESGRRCRKHPDAYAEPACPENSYTPYCEACEAEIKTQQNGGT